MKTHIIANVKSTAIANSIFFGVLLSPISTLAITIEERPYLRVTNR